MTQPPVHAVSEAVVQTRVTVLPELVSLWHQPVTAPALGAGDISAGESFLGGLEGSFELGTGLQHRPLVRGPRSQPAVVRATPK